MRAAPSRSTVVVLFAAIAALTAPLAAGPAEGADAVPTLTVTGSGEAAARPDVAEMRLGAVAQAETAGAAQSQVNTIMSRALHSIRALGIDEKAIRTSGLFVQPVFSQPPRGGGAGYEPTIVGYRAGNTVVVRLDDLELLGRVIDAGVAAGANQISGPSFSLADDTPQRREALARAVRQARVKAEAIAAAMGERIVAVRSVVEGGSSPGRPPMEYARAAAVGTPVEPGQVLVQASVTITYVIAPTQR